MLLRAAGEQSSLSLSVYSCSPEWTRTFRGELLYSVEMEYKKGMAYHEILMIAMKREEKALALYNEMQRQAEDDSSKKIFKMLCQEEAKHKLALETKYDDYMAEMGD